MADAIDTLPVELVVRGRRAVVVGAFGECVSKIERLALAGADTIVFAEGEPIDDRVVELAREGRIALADRPYTPADARDACVVFVATSLEHVGAALFADARANGRLVSTLDRPEHSTFINPAVARGAGIRIAISSGGAAPALVRALRQQFDKLLDDTRLQRFVDVLSERRAAAPRGTRGEAMRDLLEGFEVRLGVAFPRWFESGERDAEK